MLAEGSPGQVYGVRWSRLSDSVFPKAITELGRRLLPGDWAVPPRSRCGACCRDADKIPPSRPTCSPWNVGPSLESRGPHIILFKR